VIFVLVKDGVVEHCIAVNTAQDLIEFYPEHEIIEQVGEENIGWTYDGVSFTAPVGG
jgi:hypothetical protein